MSGTVFDQNGTQDVSTSLNTTTTVTVTNDTGTPNGQRPSVTLNLTANGGTVVVNATKGAEAIMTSPSAPQSTQIDYNASGGEIFISSQYQPLNNDYNPITDVTISKNGVFNIVNGPSTTSPNTYIILFSINFGAGGGTLVTSDQHEFNVDITHFFGVGQVIDDTTLNFSSISNYTITYNPSLITTDLTFYDASGNVLSTVLLGANYSSKVGTYNVGSGPLFLKSDGSGGTDIQGCLLAGTAIATPEGERPVETLEPGDLVLTASGAPRPVVWVGHRTVERASLREAEIHDPVVIAAGAFAPGIPARDLRVTPDHAILVDDRLIPARLLVNGTTIRQVPVATYTYYHVELDAHDILLAEGLTVESYLDCADRGRFANADVVALHAAPAAQVDAAAVYAAHGYRPLTLDAATVRPVWQVLADRAAALGHADAATATTADAGLHLLVDGRRIAPVVAGEGRYVFSLPRGAARVAIVSRAARPSRLQPWLDDRRRLGVNVTRAHLVSDAETTDIALDGPAAGAGWHAVERGGRRLARWTDGRAELALPPVAGPATLELTVAPLPAYPAGDLAIAA